MKNILITGALNPLALNRFKKENDILVDYRPDLPYQEIIKIIAKYHCIISRSETTIDQKLIDTGKNLSVIARAAVGIGNIDVEYATKKGILVFNTPAKNTNSAAELSVMLMLAVMRNLPSAHNSMAADQWNRHHFTGTELLDKTVGLIGLGNVGHRVAHFLNSFGCKVLAYDPYVTDKYCKEHKTEPVSLETLITESDIISIHTPKTKETINMIAREEVDKMKQGVFIINAARGGLINEDALCYGLQSKKIAGVGLDTWDIEPVKNHPLKAFPNVVMTPHIGASTLEAQTRIATSVSEETVKALNGEIVTSPVNLPDVHVFKNALISAYSSLAGKLGNFSRQFIDPDFHPQQIEFLYRGNLKAEESSLIKLTFLKELLQNTVDTAVTYVNVMQIAQLKELVISEKEDKNFSAYESAIRIRIQGKDDLFSIGGTVFGSNLRLSYINGLTFEIAPEGTILSIENDDTPGVIGFVGTTLAKGEININRFELSRHNRGGHAMALVMTDDDIEEKILRDLEGHSCIKKVKKIRL
jgi:D-3-phosphoglycerate dehydrogenase